MRPVSDRSDQTLARSATIELTQEGHLYSNPESLWERLRERGIPPSHLHSSV